MMFAIWLVTSSLLVTTSAVSTGPSKCKVELGLVVDTTKSIGKENVPKIKTFLRHLVSRFDISDYGTHVALETFDRESILYNKFNEDIYYKKDAILELIDTSIGRLRQPTRLDKALSLADKEMFNHINGERAGVRSVMVVMTDGKSNKQSTIKEDYINAVASLRGKGVRIVAIGIGKFALQNRFRRVLHVIAGENVFYADDYDALDSHSTVEDIVAIICPPAACENSAGLDAAFLVDKTRSVGPENFKLLRGFVLQLIDALNIGPNATHVGVVVFSGDAKVLNKLSDSEFQSKEAMHDLVEGISNKLGSPTRIDLALEAANEQLFTEDGGDRPGYPNVLVLLTDGRTNKESKPLNQIAPLLKEKNIRTVAVGVGKNIYEEELKEIAGNNTHTVNSFYDLPDFFTKILNETCSVDGGFSRWSFWSDCSVTCGKGVERRNRNCTRPPPQGNGKDCDGPFVETRECIRNACTERDSGVTDLSLSESKILGKISELKRNLEETEFYRTARAREELLVEKFQKLNEKYSNSANDV